jgi:hypothetical protein
MNRLKGLLGALLMCGASGVAQAEIFDLSVGDNSFRAALYGPLSRIGGQSEGQYDVGVIVRPKREDDLLIVHAGALLTGDTGMRNFELAAGLGVRAVYIGRDRDSGGAVAPGGQLEARLPGYERIGFSIYGYYAPEVLSFGEFDEYYEVGVGVDYQVLKNASVYLGYRNVNVEIEDGPKVTADNGLHVGLRLEF